jgi:hypothetical protein
MPAQLIFADQTESFSPGRTDVCQGAPRLLREFRSPSHVRRPNDGPILEGPWQSQDNT